MTESSINIIWDAPPLAGGATNITGYLVTVMPHDDDPPIVQGTTTNVTALISNKNYTISVAAVGSNERIGAASKTTVITSKSNGPFSL